MLSHSWNNFDVTTEIWRVWNVALLFKQSVALQSMSTLVEIPFLQFFDSL